MTRATPSLLHRIWRRQPTFADRISLLPLLVGLSVAVISAIAIFFGTENARLIGRIENSYYPVLQLTQDAAERGVAAQHQLQEVAATGSMLATLRLSLPLVANTTLPVILANRV